MKRNERGFSAIEAVLLLVIITVIGFTGWYVHQSGVNTKRTYSTVNSSTTATSKPVNAIKKPSVTHVATNQNLIKVPELGIQLTIPDSLKDLTYAISPVTKTPSNQSEVSVNFSSESLAKLDPSCTPLTINEPLGWISKVVGQFPGNDADAGTLYKQYADYYIAIGGSTTCLGKAETQRATLAKDFQDSYKSIQLIR